MRTSIQVESSLLDTIARQYLRGRMLSQYRLLVAFLGTIHQCQMRVWVGRSADGIASCHSESVQQGLNETSLMNVELVLLSIPDDFESNKIFSFSGSHLKGSFEIAYD